jgi:hypothetical protein
MKRRYALLMGLGLGLAGSIAGFVTIARTAPPPERVDPAVGPRLPSDSGAGETLLVVLGGVYPSRQEAEAANGQMAFGDLQGYYVVPVAQFQGFRDQLGDPGDFALVSVFRTDEGAAEFVRLAQSFGHPATILPERVRSLGGIYAGLGQETNLEGTGPLVGPIAESLPTPEPSVEPSTQPSAEPTP